MLPQTTRSSAPLDTSPVISRPLLQLQADLTMRAERGKPAVLVSCKVRSTAGASRHAGEESSSDVPAATVADDEIERLTAAEWTARMRDCDECTQLIRTERDSRNDQRTGDTRAKRILDQCTSRLVRKARTQLGRGRIQAVEDRKKSASDIAVGLDAAIEIRCIAQGARKGIAPCARTDNP